MLGDIYIISCVISLHALLFWARIHLLNIIWCVVLVSCFVILCLVIGINFNFMCHVKAYMLGDKPKQFQHFVIYGKLIRSILSSIWEGIGKPMSYGTCMRHAGFWVDIQYKTFFRPPGTWRHTRTILKQPNMIIPYWFEYYHARWPPPPPIHGWLDVLENHNFGIWFLLVNKYDV